MISPSIFCNNIMSTKNLRSKSFLLKPVSSKHFSISKLKPKMNKDQGSELINSSLSLIKNNSAQPYPLNTSLSPAVSRFSLPTQLVSLSALESRLLFNLDQESQEKVSAALSVINELMVVCPELSNILAKIKEAFEEHIEMLKNSRGELEKNMNSTSEDLKRMKKRYKKLALEVLDHQAQVKDKRTTIFELKKDKKQLTEELLKKNDDIEKMTEKVKGLEKELHLFEHKILIFEGKKDLMVKIPGKSSANFEIDSSMLSPIAPISEFTLSPNGPEDFLSPICLQVPLNN